MGTDSKSRKLSIVNLYISTCTPADTHPLTTILKNLMATKMLYVAIAFVLPALLLADTVTLTPWCANSMRIRISKKGETEPAAFQKTRQTLAQRLQEENLDELPGAFVDTCAGTPVTPKDGTPVTNGNLVVTVTGDTMKVARKDTGKILFTATTTFTAPKPKPPQPKPKPTVCAAAQASHFLGLIPPPHTHTHTHTHTI